MFEWVDKPVQQRSYGFIEYGLLCYNPDEMDEHLSLNALQVKRMKAGIYFQLSEEVGEGVLVFVDNNNSPTDGYEVWFVASGTEDFCIVELVQPLQEGA